MSVSSQRHLTDQELWSSCTSAGRSYQECVQWIQNSHATFMQKCLQVEKRPEWFCTQILVQNVIGNFRFPASPATGPKSYPGNPADLALHATGAVIAAQSGHFGVAAIESLQVAKEVVDVTKGVGEALVDSRTDAVQGGYANHSDVGFQ